MNIINQDNIHVLSIIYLLYNVSSVADPTDGRSDFCQYSYFACPKHSRTALLAACFGPFRTSRTRLWYPALLSRKIGGPSLRCFDRSSAQVAKHMFVYVGGGFIGEKTLGNSSYEQLTSGYIGEQTLGTFNYEQLTSGYIGETTFDSSKAQGFSRQ